MNILICGHRAYAARGLAPLLENAGHKVVCFSRGSEGKDGNIITGDVKSIDRNPFIEWDIDVIVNFILLKDGTPQDNIEYISALCRLAKKHHVAKLIHLSSISSYPNDAAVITDNTEMDHNAMLKGKYGSLKVLVDEYLIREREMYGLPVILLRPGFIASEDHPNPLGGIAKVLPGKIAVLIGNRQSTLPLVYRNEMHQVLKRCADRMERQPADQSHDGHERRNARPAAREHAVDALAALALAALAGLGHAGVHDLLDEREAHVGDGCRAVEPALRLHLAHDVLDGLSSPRASPTSESPSTSLVAAKRRGMPARCA